MSRDLGQAAAAFRFGFLLVPDFSTISFAAAIEPLRMANRISGRPLYEFFTLSDDGSPVSASNGVRFLPDYALAQMPAVDAVFVCGPTPVRRRGDENLLGWLRRLAHDGVALGGLCTGTQMLARAGVIDGYRCTIHWENMQSLREEFPQILLTNALFEIDRDRYSASGGTAPLDMMLHLIARQQGPEVAAAISEQFICERIRDHADRQRIPLKLRLGTGQPKLMETVALMEANIEEPIALDELAQHVGLSRRQLERLFQKYLHCVPTRYYMELRLTRARHLLLQTDLSITEVALACGFVSAPHFSNRYKRHFGIPPRAERRVPHRAEAAARAVDA